VLRLPGAAGDAFGVDTEMAEATGAAAEEQAGPDVEELQDAEEGLAEGNGNGEAAPGMAATLRDVFGSDDDDI
jgi:hypothetical protein